MPHLLFGFILIGKSLEVRGELPDESQQLPAHASKVRCPDPLDFVLRRVVPIAILRQVKTGPTVSTV